MTEMYFSADVESNGPAPGLHSMLSIGITALHPETLVEVGSFYRKLRVLPGSDASVNGEPSTMKWWAGFPKQYAEATRNPEDPRTVMIDLEVWIKHMVNGFGSDRENRPTPTFVAYPASFDFAYYCYYAWRFTNGANFGFAAFDMGSLAAGHNGRPYSEQSKKIWPETWVKPEDRVAIHVAIEDARQQARIFRRQMRTIYPMFANTKDDDRCQRCGGTGYDYDPETAGHEGACSQCFGHGREPSPDEEYR